MHLFRMITVLLVLTVALPVSLHARGRAQGAVVLRDGAPVYRERSGDEIKRTFDRGDVVVGLHKVAITWEYELYEVEGRTMVGYPKEGSARLESGWMAMEDVRGFLYDCSCVDNCIPLKASFRRAEWNPCFEEAAAEASDALDEAPPPVPAPRAAARPAVPVPGEDVFTNADVLDLIAAGLGDDLVILKIDQAPVEALDVSTDALIELKDRGVSPAVLAAMIDRAGRR